MQGEGFMFGTSDLGVLVGVSSDMIDTAATWITNDPTTDIDGDPRPMTDGSPDVAGADVP